MVAGRVALTDGGEVTHGSGSFRLCPIYKVGLYTLGILGRIPHLCRSGNQVLCSKELAFEIQGPSSGSRGPHSIDRAEPETVRG